MTVISSSMVYESATQFPSEEGDQLRCPPPSSTYGFQKLAVEYYALGAFQQYGLPFTIVRPFNCVGIGEWRAAADENVLSGGIRLALSHVVPDLVQKTLKGQNPLRILGNGSQVRHYTYAGDLARGIRLCVEHPWGDESGLQLVNGNAYDGSRTGGADLAESLRTGCAIGLRK